MQPIGTLIFFCGKMGAGKSTRARQLALDRKAVLISEDEWLAAIYPGQINSFEDYIGYCRQLKPLIKSHVQSILCTGTDVILDCPANTISQRKWFKAVFSEINAPHELIYLDTSEEICLKQIAQRRIDHPERAKFDTEAVFHHVSSFFEAPSEEEGLNIIRIERSV